MPQMYRIFYLNKAFFLCDSPNERVKNIKIENINDLCLALREWQEEDEDIDLCFYGTPKEDMLNYLKDFYTYIEAAGGIVTNEKHEFLFIKRWKIWDLPKGKLEKDETPEAAAIREVKEETGIANLSIISPASDTWHIYPWKGQTMIKRTYWYIMKSDFSGDFTPQIKEDITDVQWLNIQAAKKALLSSYRSLSENLIDLIK